MNDAAENMERQFFFSQLECIRTITASERRRVEHVFYKPRQTLCVLKTYYNRNLSEVYQKLKSIRHENLVAVYDCVLPGILTLVLKKWLIYAINGKFYSILCRVN